MNPTDDIEVEAAEDNLMIESLNRSGQSASSAKLVQSGPVTRGWLRVLHSELSRFGYKESGYYASFRSDVKHRNFVQLNPVKNSIRLFTRLESRADGHLVDTPSTYKWADYYPSLFTIRSEADLEIAAGLIEKSYRHDLLLP